MTLAWTCCGKRLSLPRTCPLRRCCETLALLTAKCAGSLVFSNGPEPLEGFRMIERHYFRDVLIKSFDFDFGFVIPNTTNTWESVYTLPTLPESLSASH